MVNCFLKLSYISTSTGLQAKNKYSELAIPERKYKNDKNRCNRAKQIYVQSTSV